MLIRNPYRAILSAYKHHVFGVHSGTDIRLRLNIMEALDMAERHHERIDPAHFARFALEHLEVWRDTIMDWVVVGGSKVMVVHYEDFLQDKMVQLRAVIGHLDIKLDSRRLQCVEFAHLEFYKRRSVQSMKHIFTKKLKDKFNKAIEEVNDILSRFGHKIIQRKLIELKIQY